MTPIFPTSRIEFKDCKTGPSFANYQSTEVALIDYSFNAVPQVYQLKPQIFELFIDPSRPNLDHTFDASAFLQVGDLIEIDTSKKLIKLTNENLLSYQYLLTFNAHTPPPDLANALHVLKNALLVSVGGIKVEFPFPPDLTDNFTSKTFTLSLPLLSSIFASSVIEEPKNIQAIVRLCIFSCVNPPISLKAANKSLCQVQL